MASSSEPLPARDQPTLCCGRWEEHDIRLDTRVQPRSKRAEIRDVDNARLKIRLTAPPTDGKANDQACKLLAKAFGVGISRVTLIRGHSSRNKVFRIASPARIPPVVLAR